MRAFPAQLVLGLAALVAFSPFTASAARPVLEIWTATPNPQGVSGCPPCNQFWRDYKTDRTLYETLNHAFEIRPRYRESNIVEANLKLVRSVPTFLWSNHRVIGYTSPEDLMARLGLRPIERQTPPRQASPPAAAPPRQMTPPAAAPPRPADDGQLKQLRADLEVLARWLEDDQARHDSTESAIKDFNLRLRGITEFLGKLQQSQPQPSPDPEPQPAETPPEKQPAKNEESEGLLESILKLGKYPATWFLGPAGGAGATALLWLYQRRKKKDLTPVDESPCADLIKQRNEALQQIALLEAELKAAKSRPAANPATDVQIQRLIAEKDEAIRQLSVLESELEEARKTVKVVKETKYRPVENRLDAEAYEFAFDALVDKHPPAEGNVAFIKAVAKQYRDGKLASTKEI